MEIKKKCTELTYAHCFAKKKKTSTSQEDKKRTTLMLCGNWLRKKAAVK
jgi:hypothetical protein